MSKAAQIILLTLSIFLAYLWLSIPSLGHYSLQAFAACILAYFILKKFNDAKVWILPETTADEMTLALFAILILVGATGLTNSWFFPLIYLYLFFLCLSLDTFVAISVSLELILFFYAQSNSFTQAEITHLISLPLILFFFLFTRRQYQEAKKHKALVKIETAQLEQISQDLVTENQWQNYVLQFLDQFLRPSLEKLHQTSLAEQNSKQKRGSNLDSDLALGSDSNLASASYQNQNLSLTEQQLNTIQTEINKLLANIQKHQTDQK